MAKLKENEVIIFVENCSVQAVETLNEKLIIKVIDFDVQGIPEDELDGEMDGKPFTESLWAKPIT